MTDDHINASSQAAIEAYHAGDKPAATSLCQSILAVMPTHPYALNLIGVITLEAKHYSTALDLFEQLLILHPDMEAAHTNVRACVDRMGRLAGEQDEAYLQRQLGYAKRFARLTQPEAWLKLAYHFYQTGRIQEAIDTYRDAKVHGVMTDSLYNNLGAHLQQIGDWGEAEAAYKAALALNPHYAAALYNLGHLISLQHRHSEAESLLRRAIDVNPDYGDAHLCLGTLLVQEGKLRAGIASIQHAKKLMPTSPLPEAALLFNQAYDPSTTAAQMLVCAERCTALLATQAKHSTHTADKPRVQSSALKIGFVSGDFKDHPVGYFTENLLRHVNREQFEWHIFSNYESSDHVAERLRGLATSWTNIAYQSDAVAKAAIEAKQIDILLDLSGHTALHRLTLFASRAAPVQISWLGWHDTTGLPTMDYLLTDRTSMPPARQSDGRPFISEQSLYLPHTRLCMMPPAFDASVNLAVTPLPALRNGYLTFGSMQVLAKLSDTSLKLWAQILAALPTAKLLIRTKQFREPEVVQRSSEHAAAIGLPLNRVSLLPPLGRGDYLSAYADIDILLDSYPYPGGTTTAEALWMGVPTITMGGNTMISMQGASLLTAASLPHWIASSEQDYLQKAVYWSEHVGDLALIRRALRDQVAGTALFDGAQFARDFEAALESTVLRMEP